LTSQPSSMAVAVVVRQESAAHAAQLVAAMDVTLQELQAREAAAAAQRLYKAAEGLNAAAIDLAALRVEYNSLVRTPKLVGWS
jgi:hypothetical protein